MKKQKRERQPDARIVKSRDLWWSEQSGWIAWGEPGWAPIMAPNRFTFLLKPKEQDSERS